MISKVVVVFMVFYATCSGSEDCKKDCGQPLGHYYELGCKPILEKGECCPTKFECTDYQKLDKSKCHYKGKTYNLNDELPEEPCQKGCFCSRYDDNIQAEARCAVVDCFQRFDYDNKDCIIVSVPNECCQKQICDKKQIDALATCYYNGKSYREGEYIPSNKPCYSCTCGAGFDNSTTIEKNTHCKKSDCGYELHHLSQISQNCAPTYYKQNGCCAHQFICPEADAQITPSTKNSAASTNAQCRFGNLMLNVGDEVKQKDKCITCKCQVPPLAVCITDQDCYGK